MMAIQQQQGALLGMAIMRERERPHSPACLGLRLRLGRGLSGVCPPLREGQMAVMHRAMDLMRS